MRGMEFEMWYGKEKPQRQQCPACCGPEHAVHTGAHIVDSRGEPLSGGGTRSFYARFHLPPAWDTRKAALRDAGFILPMETSVIVAARRTWAGWPEATFPDYDGWLHRSKLGMTVTIAGVTYTEYAVRRSFEHKQSWTWDSQWMAEVGDWGTEPRKYPTYGDLVN